TAPKASHGRWSASSATHSTSAPNRPIASSRPASAASMVALPSARASSPRKENKGVAGSVVVLGVFVADTAYRADRQPMMGETILGLDFKLGPGGKGSNQAVAAAKLGV